jgi:rare lipoprotein A
MRAGQRSLASLAAALALLAACQQAKPPASEARYVIGQPYQMGGMWSYPKEDFGASETGLAAVLPDLRAGRRTATGEVFDPGQLMAAHRTLQLPAIVSVTNLENGRELRVRVNDRGPQSPARLIGLSARAATLLGIPKSGAAQVRVTVDSAPSRALAGQLPSTERVELAIAAAPAGRVERETLAPPPGAREASWTRQVATTPAVAPVAEAALALPPNPLPENVTQVSASPGRLMLEAGTFFRRDLAQRQASRIAGLGARVEQHGSGRSAQFRVVAGPFAGPAAADSAFAAALSAGLPEARLIVE